MNFQLGRNTLFLKLIASSLLTKGQVNREIMKYILTLLYPSEFNIINKKGNEIPHICMQCGVFDILCS